MMGSAGCLLAAVVQGFLMHSDFHNFGKWMVIKSFELFHGIPISYGPKFQRV